MALPRHKVVRVSDGRLGHLNLDLGGVLFPEGTVLLCAHGCRSKHVSDIQAGSERELGG